MGKYISCGKCDKNYFKILFGFILICICLIIVLSIFRIIKSNNLDFLNDVSLLIPLLSYIGMSLCFIPELILKKKIEKKDDESNQINKSKRTIGFIKYIYNDLSDKVTWKDYIYIGLISLMLVVIDFMKIFIKKIAKTEESQYNFTELAFLLIISKFYYKMDFYKHQYLSIIIITLFGFIQYIIKTQYYYASTSNIINIILELIFQIFIGLGNSIFILYSKILMQYKYFSPYKVCYIFGIINTLLIFVIYFIISQFDFEESDLCTLRYNDQYYFDNIYIIFEYLNIGQLFLLLGFGIFQGAIKLLYNIIIDKYSVFHIVIFTENKGIADSANDQIEQYDSNIFVNLLIQLMYCLKIFISFVFLEMIELNFCGLNENTKVNIQKRVDKENNLANIENNENDSSESNDEEGEENEDNNSNNVDNSHELV